MVRSSCLLADELGVRIFFIFLVSASLPLFKGFAASCDLKENLNYQNFLLKYKDVTGYKESPLAAQHRGLWYLFFLPHCLTFNDSSQSTKDIYAYLLESSKPGVVSFASWATGHRSELEVFLESLAVQQELIRTMELRKEKIQNIIYSFSGFENSKGSAFSASMQVLLRKFSEELQNPPKFPLMVNMPLNNMKIELQAWNAVKDRAAALNISSNASINKSRWTSVAHYRLNEEYKRQVFLLSQEIESKKKLAIPEVNYRSLKKIFGDAQFRYSMLIQTQFKVILEYLIKAKFLIPGIAGERMIDWLKEHLVMTSSKDDPLNGARALRVKSFIEFLVEEGVENLEEIKFSEKAGHFSFSRKGVADGYYLYWKQGELIHQINEQHFLAVSQLFPLLRHSEERELFWMLREFKISLDLGKVFHLSFDQYMKLDEIQYDTDNFVHQIQSKISALLAGVDRTNFHRIQREQLELVSKNNTAVNLTKILNFSTEGFAREVSYHYHMASTDSATEPRYSLTKLLGGQGGEVSLTEIDQKRDEAAGKVLLKSQLLVFNSAFYQQIKAGKIPVQHYPLVTYQFQHPSGKDLMIKPLSLALRGFNWLNTAAASPTTFSNESKVGAGLKLSLLGSEIKKFKDYYLLPKLDWNHYELKSISSQGYELFLHQDALQQLYLSSSAAIAVDDRIECYFEYVGQGQGGFSRYLRSEWNTNQIRSPDLNRMMFSSSQVENFFSKHQLSSASKFMVKSVDYYSADQVIKAVVKASEKTVLEVLRITDEDKKIDLFNLQLEQLNQKLVSLFAPWFSASGGGALMGLELGLKVDLVEQLQTAFNTVFLEQESILGSVGPVRASVDLSLLQKNWLAFQVGESIFPMEELIELVSGKQAAQEVSLQGEVSAAWTLDLLQERLRGLQGSLNAMYSSIKPLQQGASAERFGHQAPLANYL